MQINTKMYKEHNTEHETIAAWQIIISHYREFKNIKGWFNKHYKIIGNTDDVFKFIDSNIVSNTDEYIELIFKLKEKFPISVNKCKCIHSQTYLMDNYDVNGLCNTCGLKIKQ